MKKTYLYSLDHAQFRMLIGSGERGLAERMLARGKESGTKLGEAELDDLEEILKAIEKRGSVAATEDRKTDELVNMAIWLIAEEAGIDAAAGGGLTEQYEEAQEAFSKSGFFKRPLLCASDLDLFEALHAGRVYGSAGSWASDTTTAVVDPGEVRGLLAALRAGADARGSKLPATVQDLLDNHVFPSLEAAARASLGLLAVTRRA